MKNNEAAHNASIVEQTEAFDVAARGRWRQAYPVTLNIELSFAQKKKE